MWALNKIEVSALTAVEVSVEVTVLRLVEDSVEV